MENVNIAKALVDIQSQMPHFSLDSTVRVKTRSGAEYTFKYASLPAIMKTIQPILSQHRTAICQILNGIELETRIIHESGEFIGGTTTLPYKEDMTTQERGAVISYFRRYALVNLLGIVADDDDDANIADGNTYQTQPPKPAQSAAPSALPREPGDEPLPTEPGELHHEPIGQNAPPPPQPAAGGQGIISDPQRKRMFAIFAETKRPPQTYNQILLKYGYKDDKSGVKKTDYDKICAEMGAK